MRCSLAILVYASLATATVTNSKRAPRSIVVASVTELGAIRQNSYVKAFSHSHLYPVLTSNRVLYGGKSYWYFDDTMTADSLFASSSPRRLTLFNARISSQSNSAAVTTDLDASNNIDLYAADWTNTNNTSTRPGVTILLTTDETNFQNAHNKSTTGCTGSTDAFCNMQFAHWPGAVLADPDRSRILVAYAKLCRGSAGARCTSTALGGETLSWGWFAAYPTLGLGARLSPSMGGVTDATGLRDSNAFGGAGGLAFTTAAVAYAWKANVSAAKGIMAVGAAGSTVFYSAALGGFYHVYEPFGSNDVYMQSAAAPEGTWSASVKLFTSTTASGQTNYAAFAHPEYTSSDGLTNYITYYQTGTGQQRLVKVVLS
ncbi:hypothetical protein BKA62DRAFT_668398 [Auriculariales sp. MPI-PUGE-AT-0066]|nr:hypothetical protein BKA62DRAFT_668398 [Auriculariales sp. MPI-PUGE-AT-0066]